jgi:hypothetical protein
MALALGHADLEDFHVSNVRDALQRKTAAATAALDEFQSAIGFDPAVFGCGAVW